jgi:hypothetical protein
MVTRVCNGCRVEREASDYYRRAATCKVCCRARAVEKYRAAHPRKPKQLDPNKIIFIGPRSGIIYYEDGSKRLSGHIARTPPPSWWTADHARGDIEQRHA